MFKTLGKLGKKVLGKGGAITTQGAANSLANSIGLQSVRILSQGSPHEMLEIQLQDIINATKRKEGIIVKNRVSTSEEPISSGDVIRDASIISEQVDQIVKKGDESISTKVTIETGIKVKIDSKNGDSREIEMSIGSFKSLIKIALQQGVNIVVDDDRKRI